jgi:anti-anti-sigma regulatory factor
MVKITETSGDEKVVTLRLDGKIVDAWVADLERLCLHYRDEEHKSIVLDFSGVTFVDENGVSMLQRIKDSRIEIINCSLFIEALLHNLVSGYRE